MSANCRARLSELQYRYSKVFEIPLEEVETRELPDNDGEVFAPNYPDLPRWTTGNCP